MTHVAERQLSAKMQSNAQGAFGEGQSGGIGKLLYAFLETVSG